MSEPTAPLNVNTRRVSGRRKVLYADFDALWDDANRLAAGEVRSLGNWSLGQTLTHLGRAMEGSIDGPTFRVPWFVKLLGRVYLWRLLVYGPFPAGLQLPRSAARRLIPTEDVSTAQGLAQLRTGIDRLGRETHRIVHPVTGPLTIEQWNRFHLTHAQLHMSFLVPVEVT